jgi:hypothetical protein
MDFIFIEDLVYVCNGHWLLLFGSIILFCSFALVHIFHFSLTSFLASLLFLHFVFFWLVHQKFKSFIG